MPKEQHFGWISLSESNAIPYSSYANLNAHHLHFGTNTYEFENSTLARASRGANGLQILLFAGKYCEPNPAQRKPS